jgi:hypothetical protein
VEKTALKAIATRPLPKTVGFDADYLPELPTYESPLNLEFQTAESLVIGLIKLKTF